MYELGIIAIIGVAINSLSAGALLLLYLRDRKKDDKRFDSIEEFIVDHDGRLDSQEELQTEFIDVMDGLEKKVARPVVVRRDNHRKRKVAKAEVKDVDTN
jgi:hypothetical protein